MSGPFKKATGLTGVAVSKTPKKTLNYLYTKILKVLEKMPADAAYRTNTENIVKGRSKIINESNKIEDMEKKINCGIIEDVIIQAEHELILARKMLIWKPWEPLMRSAPLKQWDWPPAKISEPVFEYPPVETPPSGKPGCKGVQLGKEVGSASAAKPTDGTKPGAVPCSDKPAPSVGGIKLSDMKPPIQVIRTDAGDIKAQINAVTHDLPPFNVIKPAEGNVSTNKTVVKGTCKVTTETSATCSVKTADIKKPVNEDKTGDCKPMDLNKFQEKLFGSKDIPGTKSTEPKISAKPKPKVAKVKPSPEKSSVCDPVDIKPKSSGGVKTDKTTKPDDKTKLADAKPSTTDIKCDRGQQSSNETKTGTCKPVNLSKFEEEETSDKTKPNNDGTNDKTPPKCSKIVKPK